MKSASFWKVSNNNYLTTQATQNRTKKVVVHLDVAKKQKINYIKYKRTDRLVSPFFCFEVIVCENDFCKVGGCCFGNKVFCQGSYNNMCFVAMFLVLLLYGADC